MDIISGLRPEQIQKVLDEYCKKKLDEKDKIIAVRDEEIKLLKIVMNLMQKSGRI